MTDNRCPPHVDAIVLPEGAWRETSAAPTGSNGASAARRWGLVVFLGAIAVATYGSLVPFNFQQGGTASVWQWMNDIHRGLSFASGRIDFFSNVCLYVPIGIGGMAWLARNERSALAVVPLTGVMTFGVALSLVNEGAQTMLPTRVASYSDIVAQAIGALFGCLLWIIFGRKVRGWLARLELAGRGHQRIELFLQGYLVFQFCMSVFPLDVTIHPVDLYHKLQKGQIHLIPFVGYDWNAGLVAEMLFFSFTSIPYGALAARLWMPSRTGLRNIADSVALGMAMVVGIELCQLFVQSRFTDATQVVMGAAGVFVGVLLMHGLWPPGTAEQTEQRTWLQAPGTWYAAAMLYAFLPAAFLLWPYDFVFDGAVVRQELQQMMGIPFDQLIRSSPLPISTIVIRDLLLYWPLGLLLGAGIRRTTPSVAGLSESKHGDRLSCRIRAICAHPGLKESNWQAMFVLFGTVVIVMIALGIELLQTVVPQRHADITEVLLSSAAGIAGMCGMVFGPSARSWRSPSGRLAAGKN